MIKKQAADEWMRDYHGVAPTVDIAALQAQEEELDNAEGAWKEAERSFDEIHSWGCEITLGKSSFL
jgi:hypothetical protein